MTFYFWMARKINALACSPWINIPSYQEGRYCVQQLVLHCELLVISKVIIRWLPNRCHPWVQWSCILKSLITVVYRLDLNFSTQLRLFLLHAWKAQTLGHVAFYKYLSNTTEVIFSPSALLWGLGWLLE